MINFADKEVGEERASPNVGGEQAYQLLIVEASGHELLPGDLAVAVHVHPLEDGGGPDLGGLVGLSPSALGSGHPVDRSDNLRHLRKVDPPIAVHIIHAEITRIILISW